MTHALPATDICIEPPNSILIPTFEDLVANWVLRSQEPGHSGQLLSTQKVHPACWTYICSFDCFVPDMGVSFLGIGLDAVS